MFAWPITMPISANTVLELAGIGLAKPGVRHKSAPPEAEEPNDKVAQPNLMLTGGSLHRYRRQPKPERLPERLCQLRARKNIEESCDGVVSAQWNFTRCNNMQARTMHAQRANFLLSGGTLQQPRGQHKPKRAPFAALPKSPRIVPMAEESH